ncbi:response regulator [Vallitalea guaymasensis]|uniref:Stage 0 sporulation protein A homolog n=1 Tax=Vallitalea guaymasensis TaxID=1185412 RepID=A0A8J8MDE4_9FIRM|nr:response regulator [Vallitalea guaymasensis]QUH30828.1 response regulator [Vallitalea guaymasensis]
MYKIIIVEDEIPVRNAICNIIEWEELGYELVYVSGDGQDALTYIENKQIDVILTDICMPFMDGLELSNEAKKILPTVKIVIITGYNEFEYAHKAVEIGVDHYLLKPITADEFTKMLIEIKNELDNEFSKKRNLLALKKQVETNKDILRDKFLMNLLYNKINSNIIREKVNNLGIKLEGTKYIVAVLQPENIKEIADSNWDCDYQLLEFAILNICNEVLTNYGQNICILGNDDQLIIFFVNDNQDEIEFRDTIDEIMNKIIVCVEKFYNIGMYIGVGDNYAELQDLHFSYKDALNALEYRVLNGSNKIIYKMDVEKTSSFSYHKIDEYLRELEYAIKIGGNKTDKIIDYIFSIIIFSNVHISQFRTILLKITTTILKAYEDICSGSPNDVIIDFNQFNEVFGKEKIDEVKTYYKKLCKNLSNEINKERIDIKASQMQKAYQFIYNNYQNKSLDINMICNHLNISSSYFSRIFKTETNETFMQYLTKVRMEKAKDLLMNSDYKVYEISEKVGYEDPHYFSYNFKKKTGVKPTQYRKKEVEC